MLEYCEETFPGQPSFLWFSALTHNQHRNALVKLTSDWYDVR